MINALNIEGIGNVKTVFSETKSQQSAGTAGNKEANDRDSPLEDQVETRRYIPVLSFEQEGESVGELNGPWGVAVNDRDQIAPTELFNHRVSVFSSNGTHLKLFGGEGERNSEYNLSRGLRTRFQLLTGMLLFS